MAAFWLQRISVRRGLPRRYRSIASAAEAPVRRPECSAHWIEGAPPNSPQTHSRSATRASSRQGCILESEGPEDKLEGAAGHGEFGFEEDAGEEGCEEDAGEEGFEKVRPRQ